MIDKTFPFDHAKRAFAHMKSGAHFGKVGDCDWMNHDIPKMAASGHMQLLLAPAIASAAIKL